MRPPTGHLADELASRYVFGLQHGAARTRFEHLLKYSPELRERVAAWTVRMDPLNSSLPPITPSEGVWRAIEQRIGREPVRTSWYSRVLESLGFWRTSTASLASVVIALSVIALPGGKQTAADTMVVVMSDEQARPTFTASWRADESEDRVLRLRKMDGAAIAVSTRWDIWVIPRNGERPRYLTTVDANNMQSVAVPRVLRSSVDEAEGLAMSPSGNASSGAYDRLPSWRYQGRCTKL